MRSEMSTSLLFVVPAVALNEPVQVLPPPTHLLLQSVDEIVSRVVATPLPSVVSEEGLSEPITSVDDELPEAANVISRPGHTAPLVSVATALKVNVSLQVLSRRGDGLNTILFNVQVAVWIWSVCVA